MCYVQFIIRMILSYKHIIILFLAIYRRMCRIQWSSITSYACHCINTVQLLCIEHLNMIYDVSSQASHELVIHIYCSCIHIDHIVTIAQTRKGSCWLCCVRRQHGRTVHLSVMIRIFMVVRNEPNTSNSYCQYRAYIQTSYCTPCILYVSAWCWWLRALTERWLIGSVMLGITCSRYPHRISILGQYSTVHDAAWHGLWYGSTVVVWYVLVFGCMWGAVCTHLSFAAQLV